MSSADYGVRRWTPAGLAAPIGRYSHLASAPAGRIAHIAGQVGVDAQGRLAGADLEAQTAAVLANIETLLAAAGVGPAALISLLSFVVGPGDLAAFARARDRFFDRWFPTGDWPVHSLAFVSGLARPDLLIEMQGAFALAADG